MYEMYGKVEELHHHKKVASCFRIILNIGELCLFHIYKSINVLSLNLIWTICETWQSFDMNVLMHWTNWLTSLRKITRIWSIVTICFTNLQSYLSGFVSDPILLVHFRSWEFFYSLRAPTAYTRKAFRNHPVVELNISLPARLNHGSALSKILFYESKPTFIYLSYL